MFGMYEECLVDISLLFWAWLGDGSWIFGLGQCVQELDWTGVRLAVKPAIHSRSTRPDKAQSADPDQRV